MMRIKFSLSQLLVLVVAIAVCLGYSITYRELQDSREEVALLKKKYGELNVSNPDVLHVRAMPTSGLESLHWEWEVHLPPNKRWLLQGKVGGQVPLKGIPDTRGAVVSISGDKTSNVCIISVTLSPLPEGGLTLILQSTPLHDAPSRTSIRLSNEHLPEDKMLWLFDRAGLTERLVGKYDTQVHTTDKPLFLLVHRKGITKGAKTTHNPQPTGGLVVWIEEDAAQ